MESMNRLAQAASGTSRCAQLLRKHRQTLVKSLLAGLTTPRDNRFGEPPELFAERVAEGLDLLISHVQGNSGFGELYMGQRVFELYRPELGREENLRWSRQCVEEDRAILESFLAPQVSTEELHEFDEAYRSATFGLVNPSTRHVRTLFIGDCMMAEIMSFLVGLMMADGISIDPFPVNSRDPRQLRTTLDSLPSRDFDLVFFSPFSHARLPELEILMEPANNFMPRAALDATVSAIMEQTSTLLDDLGQRYECPIFVHNAALLQRSPSAMNVAIRSLMTHRSRSYARGELNRHLADALAARNAATFRHYFLLDENALAERFGRHALGRMLHASRFQHATALSRTLAGEYRARILAVDQLLGKKLVICDLDNTLWDGIIGEGPVSHFHERQATLKALKDHGGIVLSIASKNDPANVHFSGAILSEQDFVAPQISWNQKSDAIARIRGSLNLQTRHMVFLDDRSDERALAQEAFPDLLALDPGEPEVWQRMNLWSELAHGSSDLDRTRLYREQTQRDAAGDAVIDPERPADGAALAKLGLVISIRTADSSDLKRVAELVNRTNQWNLCGTRTNFEQVRSWQSSDRSHVLLASAADRFGDMGVVCVAVVTLQETQADIPVFVLSCRVFGYAVETAMLSEIVRRTGIGSRRARLIGHFRASGQNHPCQDMYAHHGFEAVDGAFTWAGAPSLPTIPWAEIRILDERC